MKSDRKIAKTASPGSTGKRRKLEDEPVKKKKLEVDSEPMRKKRKSTDDEPVKKKKPKTELAVVTKSKGTDLVKLVPKRISKLNTKGMRSILGDSAEEIQQLLESNHNDSATTLMQKRMMQTVVDLIPYAEHAVRATKGARGVYQINSLLTSLRELMIDMQSTRDKGTIGAELVERVIRPAFLDIGMILVQEETRLDNEIRDILGIDAHRAIRTARKESTTRIAQAIQAKYGEAKVQAVTFLQG